TAAITRDELIGRRLEATAEELCGGSVTPLLSYLVRGRPLSQDEREMLRRMLDEPPRGPEKPDGNVESAGR
ncbi:MAG TPA: BlaI/MecI/CopY family transcriptional regulator, partial [Planctomycetaceae bacterium]